MNKEVWVEIILTQTNDVVTKKCQLVNLFISLKNPSREEINSDIDRQVRGTLEEETRRLTENGLEIRSVDYSIYEFDKLPDRLINEQISFFSDLWKYYLRKTKDAKRVVTSLKNIAAVKSIEAPSSNG